MHESEIAQRVARQMLAAATWSWEIGSVYRKGASLQIICAVNAKYIKWGDLVKVVRELSQRANQEIGVVARNGLPVNLMTVIVGESEVVEEDGKLKVFANVSVEWMSGMLTNMTRDDVEEAMKEAGLL